MNSPTKNPKSEIEQENMTIATLSDADFTKLSNKEQINYLQKKYPNADIDWNYKHNVVICERSKTVVEPLISQEFFIDYYKEFNHLPIHFNPQFDQKTNQKSQNSTEKKEENSKNGNSQIGKNNKTTLQKLAIEGISEVEFLPPEYRERGAKYFGEIKNWCISRDLIWGHKMPVWYNLDYNKGRKFYTFEEFVKNEIVTEIDKNDCKTDLEVELETRQNNLENQNKNHKIQIRVQDCFRITPQKPTQKGNWSQEIKILDTWFSSTLWPLSTLDFVEFTHKEKQKTEIDSEIETLQKLLAKI